MRQNHDFDKIWHNFCNDHQLDSWVCSWHRLGRPVRPLSEII